MVQRQSVIVLGCGGHSRSVTDVMLLGDPEVSIVYVDDNAKENETLYGFAVAKEIPDTENPFFVAIGDNAKRKAKMLELSNSIIISVISIKAHVGFRAKIGRGCFVGNFCHLGPEVTIGEGTIVNTASVIEHEVQIGSYCHIGPNATISGRCKIGELVCVGVGATVKDYVSICSGAIIGAGAAVVGDITEAGVYAGCPAKRIR
jgi:UDP-N-acetylbacillosamine N-acetyltransferase